MRYGIFADIHGNLEAFQEALKFYERESIDRYIFLGDIVGYGANPNEVINLLKNLNAVCIAGNHDLIMVDKLDLEYFSDNAKISLIWTKKQLTEDSLNYLRMFKTSYEVDELSPEIDQRKQSSVTLDALPLAGFICVHGSLEDKEGFKYILNHNAALGSFKKLKKQLCFIGHTHRAEAYLFKSNIVSRLPTSDFYLKDNERYIVNVGSIGQPRDNDNRLSVCVYDSKNKTVIIKRLSYDIKAAADKILNEGLPVMLAQRLYLGT